MQEQAAIVPVEVDDLKDILTDILCSMIDNPAELRVEELRGTASTQFEIHADRSDRGKLIGKEGQNIKALRLILAVWSKKYNRKFAIDIIEN